MSWAPGRPTCSSGRATQTTPQFATPSTSPPPTVHPPVERLGGRLHELHGPTVSACAARFDAVVCSPYGVTLCCAMPQACPALIDLTVGPSGGAERPPCPP